MPALPQCPYCGVHPVNRNPTVEDDQGREMCKHCFAMDKHKTDQAAANEARGPVVEQATCHPCEVRREVEALQAQSHAEHVALGSVLISEEPDRTVVSIYAKMSPAHRQRLLSLLSEVEQAALQGDVAG